MKAARNIGEIDATVHLASLVPKNRGEDRQEPMFRANVTGTVNVLDVFAATSASFIVASTAEVYGEPSRRSTQPRHGPISEDTPVNPRSHYGHSKAAAELASRALADSASARVAILRFTVLYGPDDLIDRAIPNFVRSASRGERPQVFGGEEQRDYLHVDDAAEAVWRVLSTSPFPTGTYNVGSGRGTAVRDAAAAVLARMGSTLTPEILPRRAPAYDIVLDVSRFRAATGFEPKLVFPAGLEMQVARR